MKINVLLILAMFAVGIPYLILDKKLYYYGRHQLDIYNSLPFKIKPAFWDVSYSNLGFVLLDDYEMTTIAKGNKYSSSNIVVNEVLKYGFDETLLVALVTDVNESKHLVKLSKLNLSIPNFLTDIESINNLPKYSSLNWIEIKGNEAHIARIQSIRNLLFLSLIAIVTLAVFRIIAIRKPTHLFLNPFPIYCYPEKCFT